MLKTSHIQCCGLGRNLEKKLGWPSRTCRRTDTHIIPGPIPKLITRFRRSRALFKLQSINCEIKTVHLIKGHCWPVDYSWGILVTSTGIQRIFFIFWKLSFLKFIKLNFDGDIKDTKNDISCHFRF